MLICLGRVLSNIYTFKQYKILEKKSLNRSELTLISISYLRSLNIIKFTVLIVWGSVTLALRIQENFQTHA